MAALPPALSELEIRLGFEPGTLEGADKARAQSALNDATALALEEAAESTAERWRANAPAVVELVILKAARREYENPRGIRQETYGEHTVGGITESSGVYLTAHEVTQIIRAATRRRKGARSLRIGSAYLGPTSIATFYVPVPDGRPVPLLAASDLQGARHADLNP